jgi:hypothetical protein
VNAYEIVRRWKRHVLFDALLTRRKQEEKEAARQARIAAGRRVLLRDGTLRRVARVRRAMRVRRQEFHDRFMDKPRQTAQGLEDICRMAVEVLIDMGVDMTDVQLQMRRKSATELKFDPLPSYESGRRALALVDGQPLEDGVPFDELLALGAEVAAAVETAVAEPSD